MYQPAAFGGGGHRLAAGYTSEHGPEGTVERLVAAEQVREEPEGEQSQPRRDEGEEYEQAAEVDVEPPASPIPTWMAPAIIATLWLRSAPTLNVIFRPENIGRYPLSAQNRHNRALLAAIPAARRMSEARRAHTRGAVT